MTLTDLLVPTYRNMLQGLVVWLGKAQEQIDDADALMSARLASDMFPLATQVRFACTQAYEGVCRLKHQPLPDSLEALVDEGRNAGDVPGTLADAVARVEETLAFLEPVSESELDAHVDEDLALELPMGIAFDFTGNTYARDWALPQFYFHIMAAYAILRAQGVEIGKADYVAHAFGYLRPGTAPAG